MSLADTFWWKVNYTDALVDRERKTILEWSAKAGCTIGSMMFYRRMGILEEARAFSPWAHVFRAKVFYRRYGLATYEDLRSPDFFKIKLVREPFDRAVSGYLHAMQYPDPNLIAWAGANPPDLSFRRFLDYLETRDLFTCNPHYRTQWKGYEAEGVVFDQILRLEALADDLGRMARETGVVLDPTGLTSAHHFTRSKDLLPGAADLPYARLEGKIPAYDSFRDDDTEGRVRRLYAADFAYGYATEASRRGPLPEVPSRKGSVPTGNTMRRVRYRLFDLLRRGAIPLRRRWHD